MTTVRAVDRWAGQPAGFCRPVADVVYKAIMSMPDDDSAALLGRIIVGALIQDDLMRHGEQITKALDQVAEARRARLAKRLSRTALEKARAGRGCAGELRQLAILTKAFEQDPDDLSRRAKQQQRDLHSGRFVREHQQIGYNARFAGLDDKHAKQFGIPEVPNLKGKDKARYQQAYQQLHGMLSSFAGMGDNALVHLHIGNASDPTVGTRTVLTSVPKIDPNTGQPMPNDLRAHLGEGEYLHSASVSVVPPVSAAGATYDVLDAFGPTTASVGYHTVATGAGSVAGLRGFRHSLEETRAQDEYIPSQRVFRNLESGSKLIGQSLGPNAPRQVQMALQVGQHVGRYGPEAQRVIGPAADKAAYRYRGVERPVSARLANALESIRRSPNIGPDDKREALLHGRVSDDGTWEPSGVLDYFRRELPSINLNDLQLKSGVVPPSRGIVLDRQGRTVAEAVGYGDDHYLPFNLKGRSMRGLKGGEYIRTRTFGGPTTEDIYTGLISGAKGMTVVSHNGVYTIDFHPDLKGGRRFNDNAARMVSRYGHLLDAVRSGQVKTGGIDPSRYEELERQAARRRNPERDPEGYDNELTRLVAHEHKSPTLSEQQQAGAAMDFFNAHADRLGGEVANQDDLVERLVQARAVKAHNVALSAAAGSKVTPPSMETVREQVRRSVPTDRPVDAAREVAAQLGMSRQFEAHMEQAAKANKAALTPLALNGEGYFKAMQALQEQFPHYVARVEYHPWSEARNRPAASATKEDTGYVRPRHTRAAAALSGYFDEHVARPGAEVKGKVFADSTRWQNRNADLRPFKTAEERKATSEGEKTAAGKLDPETAKAVQAEADHALFHAIKGSTTVASSAKDVDVGHDNGDVFKGTSLVGHPLDSVLKVGGVKQLMPATTELFNLGSEEWATRYEKDPVAMRAKLKTAKREQERFGLLTVDDKLWQGLESGGMPAGPKPLPKRASDALANPGVNYDFPDAPDAYRANSGAEPDEIQDVYASEPAITDLIRSGELPAQLSSPDFTRKASALLDDLRRKRSALLLSAKDDGVLPTAEDWAEIDEPAEGLLRARQLQHNYERAQAAAAKRTAAEQRARDAERPIEEHHNSVNVGLPPRHPDQPMDDYLKGLDVLAERYGLPKVQRPDPNDSRTIEG